MEMDRKIRVMVVDDSALMRKLLPIILQKDPQIEVVATAINGIFALQKAEKLRPDVITLDMDMPGMDGLTALKHIVERWNIPVIVVSSLTTEGANITMKALEIGALDFVTKPHHEISVHINDIARELIRKVKAVAGSSPGKLKPAVEGEARELRPEYTPIRRTAVKPPRSGHTARKVVAIGISTGGPYSLSCFLPLIPAVLPAGILVVQHMPPGFTEVLATRLNKICAIEVKEATDGDLVLDGRALVAPGGRHMKIKKTPVGTVVILSDAPPVNGHRPSADVLFWSVAKEYGPDALGVIMTGMGEDGAEGMGNIKRAGGGTIAQDEESSIVFGMPRVAIERGYAQRVVGLSDMAPAIVAEITENGADAYAS